MTGRSAAIDEEVVHRNVADDLQLLPLNAAAAPPDAMNQRPSTALVRSFVFTARRNGLALQALY